MVSISSHMEHHNSEQATNLIIERTKQLVNRLVEDRGYDKPPFLPAEFAHLQGIKIVKADLGEVSAVLLRHHDGLVIKVNQNHPSVRQNFSCAHEIGHVLFSQLGLESYVQSIEHRTFNPQSELEARHKAKEQLCDVVATELLMPEHVFGKYLSSFGVSVRSIERLANIFKVSIQAAAIRIAEVSPEPCLALRWNPWPRNRPKGLRLAVSRRNLRSKANCIPLHTFVSPQSALYKSYQDGIPVKSFKKFKVDNDVKRLPMESKGFGRGDTRYVISLAFPDREGNKRNVGSGV